jgi:hypothetical protein
MPRAANVAAVLRRVATFAVAWVLAGAFYLLLIDTPSLPELLVGAGAAALAAGGFVLAVEQQVLGAEMRARWLRRAWRPIAKVPSDIAAVSAVALSQLVQWRSVRGEFRSATFRRGESEKIETGRQALAEGLGSFAPNTIIIGVDIERERVLAHQLRRTGGREAIDVLELG